MHTLTSGKYLQVLVNNSNMNSHTLHRDLPISTASIQPNGSTVVNISIKASGDNYKPMTFSDQNARSIFALNSIKMTPQVDSIEDETDLLEEGLEFDPSEIPSAQIDYNEQRLNNILDILNPDSWKVTEEVRQKAIAIITLHQKAFYLKGEPLPSTHLIKHKIELSNENVIIHTPPPVYTGKTQGQCGRRGWQFAKVGSMLQDNQPTHISHCPGPKKRQRHMEIVRRLSQAQC